MTFPATVQTRQVTVGIPRDCQWNGQPATVVLTPGFITAVDTVGGDVVRGTPIVVTLNAANAFAATVTLLASDTTGLSTSPVGFTWRVACIFGDGLPSPAPFSVWVPKWTGGGAAPVLDLDLVAPVSATSTTVTAVPVVTPDQLAAALAGLGGSAPARHFMKASGGSGSGTTMYTTLAGYFATIPLTAVTYDTAGGFNTGSSLYTVAVAGVYEVNATVRPCDYVGTFNFGLGVGTANADSPTFAWFQKPGSGVRSTFIYAQTMKFNAADSVRLFGYCDSSGTQDIAAASLSLSQIG